LPLVIFYFNCLAFSEEKKLQPSQAIDDTQLRMCYDFVYLRLFDKIDHNTGALSFITNNETRITVIDWTWIFPFLITEFLIQWHPSIKKIKSKGITTRQEF
jgi:hypothetical protein